MTNKRITLQDIANELGISRNTVSKAINNTGSISEKTKNKILQKAAEMGYKQFGLLFPAQTPPSIDTFTIQSSKEIALFTNSLVGSSHFGSKLLDSFQKKIGTFGYKLSFYMIRDHELDELVYPANFNEEQTAGILCLEVFSEAYSRFLCSQSIPLLFVDTAVNHFDLNLAADLLYMENKTSSYLMLKALADQGYKNISFVGDPYHCHSFYERWDAYCQIMDDYHRGSHYEDHQHDTSHYSGTSRGMLYKNSCILDSDCNPYNDVDWLSNRIRHLPALPDVFFCANDFLAICTMRALKSMNLIIPDDVMVCGFDNSPESVIVEPSLTTVMIPSSSMGFTAAELLLSRIEHPEMPFRTSYIKTDVVYRNSTKKELLHN